MTKTKARQRAKAKAAQKPRKKQTNTDRTAPTRRRGQFDPGPGSIKGPQQSAKTKEFAGARAGAARSR